MENHKTLFDHFVREDRFELHSYLIYLFNQLCDQLPESIEEKLGDQ
ncbi:hypothetical protein [Neobacillus niacini]|nr:hypothetical protein [Neobacillus niacini]MDR6998933.1 hypothetical protein [Neobacillus niacini]